MATKITPKSAVGKRFGRALKQFRLNAGLPVKIVGKLVNLRTDTIKQLERGTRDPSLLTLIKLGQLYNITLDQLILGQVPSQKVSSQVFDGPLRNIIIVHDKKGNIIYIGPDRRQKNVENFKGRNRRSKK